jgi:hypothetical protein
MVVDGGVGEKLVICLVTKGCYRFVGTTGVDPVQTGQRSVPVNHFTDYRLYR